MSRFKLFGMMTAMLAGIMHSSKLTVEEKGVQASKLNSQSGGMLFGGSVMPSRTLNQRQRRKLDRQVPQRRK